MNVKDDKYLLEIVFIEIHFILQSVSFFIKDDKVWETINLRDDKYSHENWTVKISVDFIRSLRVSNCFEIFESYLQKYKSTYKKIDTFKDDNLWEVKY